MFNWIKNLFKSNTDLNKQDDELYDSVEYDDSEINNGSGTLVITFNFRKKGISYELEQQTSYDNDFIKTLYEAYGINEFSDQASIDKFLSMGLMVSNSNNREQVIN